MGSGRTAVVLDVDDNLHGYGKRKHGIFFNELHLRAMIYCLFSKVGSAATSTSTSHYLSGPDLHDRRWKVLSFLPCEMSFGIGKNSFMIFYPFFVG